MHVLRDRGLRLGDVNLTLDLIEVRAASAKNRYRVRTIPLSSDAHWALERLYQRAWDLGSRSPKDCLFPFRVAKGFWDPRRPMSDSGIKRSFGALRKAAGVPWLRVHDLRHSSITRMAEAAIPIATIMSMAGHISAAMTRHYTQVSESAKRKAIIQAFEQHPITAPAPRGLPAPGSSVNLERTRWKPEETNAES